MKSHQIAANILIGLLCISLLTSCQRNDNATTNNYLSNPQFNSENALPQYDHNKSWAHRLGDSSSCVVENTLYFIGSIDNRHYIFYCDLATGISGPLCGKPECAHNTNECNAYTYSLPFGLSFYDEKLYWLDLNSSNQPTVYCMNLDGTARKSLCSFSWEQYQRIGGARVLAFHRGYLIYGGPENLVTEGVARYGVLVLAVSLTTGEETVILDESFEEGIYLSLELVPYRNRLYLVTNQWAIPGEGTQVEEYFFSVSQWSLKTHELLPLYSQTGTFSFREVWPTEGGLLLSSNINGEIYKYKFITHEFNLLLDLNSTGESCSRMQFSNDYLIDWTLTKARLPHIYITDLKGNVVYSENLDIPDWPSCGQGYCLMGADNDNLYAKLTMHTQKDKKQYLTDIIVQIPLDGGGTVRELWSVERELG